jgi:hypothetical protein
MSPAARSTLAASSELLRHLRDQTSSTSALLAQVSALQASVLHTDAGDAHPHDQPHHTALSESAGVAPMTTAGNVTAAATMTSHGGGVTPPRQSATSASPGIAFASKTPIPAGTTPSSVDVAGKSGSSGVDGPLSSGYLTSRLRSPIAVTPTTRPTIGDHRAGLRLQVHVPRERMKFVLHSSH